MTKVGLIVAIETDSIFAYYTDRTELPCPAGFDLYYVEKDNQEIYIIHTGLGEISAAAGVQYLITKYGVDVIVNFGVVGGLSSEMKVQKVCVIERVVHYKFDCSEFMDLKVGQVDGHDSIFIPTDKTLCEKALSVCDDLKPATCCSADKFVGKESDKLKLHMDFEGDVCDMESAAIVLTSELNHVPCLLLKAVSDGLAGGAKQFYEELQDAALVCLKVTDKVIESL